MVNFYWFRMAMMRFYPQISTICCSLPKEPLRKPRPINILSEIQPRRSTLRQVKTFPTPREKIIGIYFKMLTGGSDDWAKAIGIKYSYTLELPPTHGVNSSGFSLEPEAILPVAQDIFPAIRVFIEEIAKS